MANLNVSMRKNNTPKKNTPNKQGMAKAITPQRGIKRSAQKPDYGNSSNKKNQRRQSIVEVKEDVVDDVQMDDDESDSVEVASEVESDENAVPSDIEDSDEDAQEADEDENDIENDDEEENNVEVDDEEESDAEVDYEEDDEIEVNNGEVEAGDDEDEEVDSDDDNDDEDEEEEEGDDNDEEEESKDKNGVSDEGQDKLTKKETNYNGMQREYNMLYKATTIEVCNINLTTNDEELKDKFSKYGSIECIWLRKTEMALPSGTRVLAVDDCQILFYNTTYTAYICYSTSTSAEEAIKCENGKVFNDRHLWVGMWAKTAHYTPPEGTIYITTPFKSQVYEDVYSAFISYGEIEFIHMIRSSTVTNGDCQFNTFVTFKSPTVVSQVVNDRNVVIRNKSCTAVRCNPNKRNQIVVSGLKFDQPAEEVKKAFSKYGELVRFIMKRGICEITYATSKEVESALKAEISLGGNKLKIVKNNHPYGKLNATKPTRGFIANRPPRGFNANRPPRGFNANGPSRGFQANRPFRGFHANRPPRGFNAFRSPRGFHANRSRGQFRGHNARINRGRVNKPYQKRA